MKNKNKKIIFKLIFTLPILILAVFCFGNHTFAEESLKISKVQFDGGTGKADEDFIEITNTSENEINLKGYRLAKITSSGKRYDIKAWSSETIVPAGEKYVWANSKNGFAESIGADASTTATISSENEIVIILGKLDDGIIIDSFVQEKDDDNGEDENGEDENGEDENGNEESAYIGKVLINEIYPAPDTKLGEEEFVEIIVLGDEKIDFADWKIEDEKNNKAKISKTGKEGDYFVFYGSFSLNNDSKGDTVFLYDDKGKLVDSRKYEGGKSKYAYAFDGSAWRWTSSPTPNGENKFDKILSGKIKMDDKIYAGVYADFEAVADSDAQKFTWDFGDNHKSYLKKTRHKYEKAGTYEASLKITGSGEDALYSFSVKVEKFKAPKIRIVAFSPNPKGNDSKNEWVRIENKSKKDVNLKNWSIATGWEKLYNHPIREDFKIKKGKTKKLERNICAFTLNNSKTKIELRDPSGKVVQKIKYDREKNKIEEDEIYEKDENGWEWIKDNEIVEDVVDIENVQDVLGVEVFEVGTGLKPVPTVLTVPAPDMLGKYSPNPDWEKRITRKNDMINEGLTIKLASIDYSKQPRVLGIQKIKTFENYYIFTKPTNEKHWAVIIVEKIYSEVNLCINSLFFKLYQ